MTPGPRLQREQCPGAARGEAVALRYLLPKTPELRPYITTFYLAEVDLPEGEVIEDRLHPEWGNIRFSVARGWEASLDGSPPRPSPRVSAIGPTSRGVHFRGGATRTWGVGLLPQGWARFVDAPANAYADRYVDAQANSAFAGLAALDASLFGAGRDPEGELARIEGHMLALLAARPPVDDEAKIAAAHRLLVDGEIGAVTELAERLALSSRSIERLCLRAFGFPPKLLLRRQRFLRSLAQFMLDPSLKWITTIDCQYVDQAHFIRDFRRFMGMSPSLYAALDHPILRAAAKARSATAGEAMQVLHRP